MWGGCYREKMPNAGSRGEKEQKKWLTKNITFFNYLLSKELEQKINQSKVVICRSGYSSVMDLAILQKKVLRL